MICKVELADGERIEAERDVGGVNHERWKTTRSHDVTVVPMVSRVTRAKQKWCLFWQANQMN
jgi:hypothetical protein